MTYGQVTLPTDNQSEPVQLVREEITKGSVSNQRLMCQAKQCLINKTDRLTQVLQEYVASCSLLCLILIFKNKE